MCPVETIQGFFIRERTAAHGHSLPFPYGEGQVIHMKKRLFLILSVGIMLFAGCGSEGGITTGTPAEKTGTVADTKKTDMAGETKPPVAVQTDTGEGEKRETGKGTKENEPERKEAEAAKTPEPRSVSNAGQEDGTEPAQGSADVHGQEQTKQEEPKPEEPKETEPKEAEAEKTEPEEPKQQEQAAEQTVASYDPVSVCSQAVAKCQAGGMITTTDNLASLLSEGTITQEEYNSYYPYDGLGYYSVFVETDLNRASTTSGRKLGSEDGIADYIAGMMLLETEPVFYIEYAGVYSLNGTDFYEFRCYR